MARGSGPTRDRPALLFFRSVLFVLNSNVLIQLDRLASGPVNLFPECDVRVTVNYV